MANEPEVIREQMRETRTALSDKLETLEHQVVDTLHDAKAAVTDTVASVKDALHSTVQTVKDSMHDSVDAVKGFFDVEKHAQRRPWTVLGAAVAIGFLGGRLIGRRKRTIPLDDMRGFASYGEPMKPAWSMSQGGAPDNGNGRERGEPHRDGWLKAVGEKFHDELTDLKGMAIGTLMNVFREMVVKAAPEPLGPKLEEVINRVTTKFGAEPIQGHLMKPNEGGDEHEFHDAEDERAAALAGEKIYGSCRTD